MAIIYGLESYYYGSKGRGTVMRTGKTAMNRLLEGFEGTNETSRTVSKKETETVESNELINFSAPPQDKPVDGKSAAAGKD